MRFFTASFVIQTKQKINKTWFPLLLIFLLVLAFVFVQFTQSSSSLFSFTAGVAYSSQDPFSVAVMERLDKMELIDFQPLVNKSQEELRELVENKSYDSIYILKENLQDRIIEGRVNGAIPSFVSPNSSLSTFVDKWVFASVLIQASPQVSLHQLAQTVGLPINELEPLIQESFSWYENNYQFVVSQPQWLGKEGFLPPGEHHSLGTIRLSRGLLCLVLLAFSALCLGQSIENQKQTSPRLTTKENRLFALGGFASLWFTSLLIAAPPLLLLQFSGLNAPSLLLDILSLVILSFFLSGLVLFLSRLLSSREGIASGAIFSLLLLVVFGGIVFDPLEVSSWLNKLAHFTPTYYYMEGLLRQNFWALGALFSGGLLLLALSLLKPTGFKRRRV